MAAEVATPFGSPIRVADRQQLAVVVEALVAVTVLVACTKCGRQVPVVKSMPTLIWRGVPCGYVVLCVCGLVTTFATPGREKDHLAAEAAMAIAFEGR